MMRMPMSSGRRTRGTAVSRTLGLVAAALVLSTAACGSDDSGSGQSGAAASSTSSVTTDQAIAALVPDEVKGKGTLSVASEVYPPAVIQTSDQAEPSGWEIAIANDVAALMGLKADISIVPFDGLIASMQANRFDVAMGELAITPERTAVLTMVESHSSGDSFLVAKDSDLKVSSATDLCGHSIAALVGSIESQRVQEMSDQCTSGGKEAIDQQTFKDQASVNLALQGKKVELSIGSTSQLSYVTQQAKDQFKLLDASFLPALPTGVIIADSPYQEQMAKAVSAAVQKLIDSGRMQDILDQFNSGKGNIQTATVHAAGT